MTPLSLHSLCYLGMREGGGGVMYFGHFAHMRDGIRWSVMNPTVNCPKVKHYTVLCVMAYMCVLFLHNSNLLQGAKGELSATFGSTEGHPT